MAISKKTQKFWISRRSKAAAKAMVGVYEPEGLDILEYQVWKRKQIHALAKKSFNSEKLSNRYLLTKKRSFVKEVG